MFSGQLTTPDRFSYHTGNNILNTMIPSYYTVETKTIDLSGKSAGTGFLSVPAHLHHHLLNLDVQ